ncbi:serine protease, partial [Pseudoxanthomonas sp. KAs_5_3]
MDTDSSANGLVDRPADAPVLEPRPVYRPQIDPASRQVFGRPSGVDGSFSPTSVRGVPAPDVVVGSPDPVLAEAFG